MRVLFYLDESFFVCFSASIRRIILALPFLHPQPEDAPGCGDRDPLITDIYKKSKYDYIYIYALKMTFSI